MNKSVDLLKFSHFTLKLPIIHRWSMHVFVQIQLAGSFNHNILQSSVIKYFDLITDIKYNWFTSTPFNPTNFIIYDYGDHHQQGGSLRVFMRLKIYYVVQSNHVLPYVNYLSLENIVNGMGWTKRIPLCVVIWSRKIDCRLTGDRIDFSYCWYEFIFSFCHIFKRSGFLILVFCKALTILFK